MINNENLLQTTIKKHIADALSANIEATGGANVYSLLSYYNGEHKLDSEISKKYGIECTGFHVSDNDCHVNFKFTNYFTKLNMNYGVSNSLSIRVLNHTGDNWITSGDCADLIKWIRRVEMNFTDPSNDSKFDTDAYLAEFERIKLFCLLAA
jgi:hypothetical protein